MIFGNTTFANELASSAYVRADMSALVFTPAGGEKKRLFNSARDKSVATTRTDHLFSSSPATWEALNGPELERNDAIQPQIPSPPKVETSKRQDAPMTRLRPTCDKLCD